MKSAEMKSMILMCLVLLFASAMAHAQDKVEVCHKGSVTAQNGQVKKMGFVINISSNAVQAHIKNHGDCAGMFDILGSVKDCSDKKNGKGQCATKVECSCMDDGVTNPGPVSGV